VDLGVDERTVLLDKLKRMAGVSVLVEVSRRVFASVRYISLSNPTHPSGIPLSEKRIMIWCMLSGFWER